MTTFKSLGSLLGIEVVAHIPENPMESPYTFCRVKSTGQPITGELVSFSIEQLSTEEDELFTLSIVTGITVALKRKLINKD